MVHPQHSVLTLSLTQYDPNEPGMVRGGLTPGFWLLELRIVSYFSRTQGY